jgi:hypothetical protein
MTPYLEKQASSGIKKGDYVLCIREVDHDFEDGFGFIWPEDANKDFVIGRLYRVTEIEDDIGGIGISMIDKSKTMVYVPYFCLQKVIGGKLSQILEL